MYTLPFRPLWDDLQSKVKYKNSKSGVEYETSVQQLLEIIFENNTHNINNYLHNSYNSNIILQKYNFLNSGFMCQVLLKDGYYSGNILINESRLHPNEIKYLSNMSNKDLLDIYIPHDGLTVPFGFDCIKPMDIWLSRHGVIESYNKDVVCSFKTKDYVIDELKKYSDSLRSYLINKKVPDQIR
jgi:hypothetical protein